METSLAAAQIRSRVFDYLEGFVSFDEFQEDFVPETWDLNEGSDPVAADLVGEIELATAEYTSGHCSQEEFKDLLRRATETVVLLSGDPCRVSTSAVTMIAPYTLAPSVLWSFTVGPLVGATVERQYSDVDTRLAEARG